MIHESVKSSGDVQAPVLYLGHYHYTLERDRQERTVVIDMNRTTQARTKGLLRGRRRLLDRFNSLNTRTYIQAENITQYIPETSTLDY